MVRDDLNDFRNRFNQTKGMLKILIHAHFFAVLFFALKDFRHGIYGHAPFYVVGIFLLSIKRFIDVPGLHFGVLLAGLFEINIIAFRFILKQPSQLSAGVNIPYLRPVAGSPYRFILFKRRVYEK